jgi:hypothetical protein
MSQFFKYFRENMQALGLPAPESLYANQGLVVGHVETLLAALKKFGRNATMGELIGATTGLEKLAVAHTVWATLARLSAAWRSPLAARLQAEHHSPTYWNWRSERELTAPGCGLLLCGGRESSMQAWAAAICT